MKVKCGKPAWSQLDYHRILSAEQLNEDGMVVDFTHIKEVVKGSLTIRI